ncbi:hypothetical protein H4R34_004364 [Dimargaris verticillata]|uniref:P-loop containing nucleoside triphosphate hydrolase protein n=1 Tax=Dimargaris verticillata TaxID=2761393 RepID=A0A9W8B0R4_9FUNG|nr:hypothetical protein H4R34_004364 [Dimargaris verticillata]
MYPRLRSTVVVNAWHRTSSAPPGARRRPGLVCISRQASSATFSLRSGSTPPVLVTNAPAQLTPRFTSPTLASFSTQTVAQRQRLADLVENALSELSKPMDDGLDESTSEKVLARFKRLGLSDAVATAVAQRTTWEAPLTIQRRVIPSVLAGDNVVASAFTGQGKTAAFALPLLDRIHQARKSNPALSTGAAAVTASPVALILAPSCDLASQIVQEIDRFGESLGIRTIILSNETNCERQLLRFEPSVDIVVGTPGRIAYHLNKAQQDLQASPGDTPNLIPRPRLDLSGVRHFVLDECDRLFSLGFLAPVTQLWQALPRNNPNQKITMQTIVTSATIAEDVHNFVLRVAPIHALHHLNAEMRVSSSVTQIVYDVSKQRKTALLLYFLRRRGNVSLKGGKVLVFARTIARTQNLAERLGAQGFLTAALHSDCTTAQRKQIISNFSLGNLNVVVATDLAMRGIDIPGITHVVNYDVPSSAEDYIHRVGRTGRAGQTGTALTFVSKEYEDMYLRDHQLARRDEQELMRQIEAKVGDYRSTENGIQRRKIPGPFRDEPQVWKERSSYNHIPSAIPSAPDTSDAVSAPAHGGPGTMAPVARPRNAKLDAKPSPGATIATHTFAHRQPGAPVRAVDEVFHEYSVRRALGHGLDPRLLKPNSSAKLDPALARKNLKKYKAKLRAH